VDAYRELEKLDPNIAKEERLKFMEVMSGDFAETRKPSDKSEDE